MVIASCTRRTFLAATALSAQVLPKEVTLLPGPVNGLVYRRGERTALFYGDPSGRLPQPDTLFLTHPRRDLTWAAERFLATGRRLSPFWPSLLREKRLHDYENQGARVPVRSFPPLSPAPRFPGVESIETPGFAREAWTHFIAAGGKKIAVTGDLIYSGGRLLEWHCLQDAIGELKVRGYHGYAARASQLIASLRQVLAAKPDLLVPARGPVISDPAREIPVLIERIENLYANYLSTDAYRWYFGPANYQSRAQRVLGSKAHEAMPYAETREAFPGWLRAVGNSRLIVSQSGEAILVDCGSKRNWDQVRSWKEEGVFRKLSAIYITHYHDDHTDYAQAAADEFGAEIWSSSNQTEILREPQRFRMPCLTPNPIPSLKPWRDGEKRRWNEFALSSFDFPGQTLYHGALLVEPVEVGDRVLFAGDSFTPSGMDDYCLLNRNFVGARQGLDFCLELTGRLGNVWLVNQHVNPLFRFSAEQLSYMRAQLAKRRELHATLTPFPGANFAVDEQWLRLDPYVRMVAPGERIALQAVIWNHAAAGQDFRVRLELPPGWQVVSSVGRVRIPAGEEGAVRFQLRAPSSAQGVEVLTASVRFGDWDLRHWAEAIVET
jgi:glyoxylase-like metal-dependent hydrolase (beta-lactamase superfamily II)